MMVQGYMDNTSEDLYIYIILREGTISSDSTFNWWNSKFSSNEHSVSCDIELCNNKWE